VVSALVSPLETVARNHGAVMAERHGRRVPAHFGSVGAEEAVCLKSVGMADRSDRETLELRGAPSAIEEAFVALGEHAWYSFIAADRALARTEDAPACVAALRSTDVTVHDNTPAYAAIGLVGPRAKELLDEIDLNPTGVIVQEAPYCFEVILPAERGPELWEYLLEAGAPYDLACVGHDALDRLAASHRMGYWS
jgi:glycine cleavage system aminomethyltransferase T